MCESHATSPGPKKYAGQKKYVGLKIIQPTSKNMCTVTQPLRGNKILPNPHPPKPPPLQKCAKFNQPINLKNYKQIIIIVGIVAIIRTCPEI